VLRDLITALRRLAPQDGGWLHDTEGPDDMPAHIRTMLTATSLQVPVIDGRVAHYWRGFDVRCDPCRVSPKANVKSKAPIAK